MKKNITVLRHSPLLCLLGTCLLLSGCEGTKPQNTAIQSKSESTSEQSVAVREAKQLAQCQKELEALKPISAKQHLAFQQEFARLMNGAAQYSSVRTQVNSEIQDTMDALYRYKVKRLCSDISQTLLTGLAEIGEKAK